MTVRVVALGDSLSCGEGVGVRLDPSLTWPSLLTAALPGGHLQLLARAGSRVRDVLAEQVPQVSDARPDLVTVLAGLNDVARSDFRPDDVTACLTATVDGLLPTGAIVLLARLPVPAEHLPLPPALRRAVVRRARTVDDAVQALASRHEQVALLDLRAVPGLRSRRAWDVDRVHLNAAGHALLAQRAASVLRGRGWWVDHVRPPALPPPPGLLREGRWLVRDGLPWLLLHARSVLAPAAALSLRRA